MQPSPQEIKTFQTKILSWYREHQRDLPWRKTRDPYKILISEVMSQQTQIGRVIPKYEVWLEAFPTVQDLASARTSEVLRHWSGLGYNRRAMNVQKAAQMVVNHYNGVFPMEPSELEKLPGIGRYTSHAISCFAYDQQVAVVDTNVRKVIAVEFFKGVLPKEKVVEETAQKILPKGQAYAWNQALMDYAGAVLKEHKILPRSGILLRKTKQSHFFSSNRYFRGQTMKLLLASSPLLFTDLLAFFIKQGREIEKGRLQILVEQLGKEGFLSFENGVIKLPDLPAPPKSR